MSLSGSHIHAAGAKEQVQGNTHSGDGKVAREELRKLSPPEPHLSIGDTAACTPEFPLPCSKKVGALYPM